MSLYKNCGWWKNFDCIFEFSLKRYIRNTINISCAKIVFPSVIIIIIISYTFMQGIDNYIPETQHVSRVYNVAAVP